MKTFTTLLAFVLTTAFTLTATAQEIAGTWKAESVSGAEPPEGVELTLTFGDDNKATASYTLAGETQSWHYSYTIEEDQLNLEPANAFGKPQTVTYDIKIVEEKLQLLTPKPEPVEEETEEAETEGETEGEGESEAEGSEPAEGEESAESEEAAEAETEAEAAEDAGSEAAEEGETEEGETEEAEEEETREPVWVLVKA
ncbi:MAG: lipocalin family protein [Planctomycetota bacterium]